MEWVRFGDLFFHKFCLKCQSCNKTLTSQEAADYKGEIYCKNCIKNIGPGSRYSAVTNRVAVNAPAQTAQTVPVSFSSAQKTQTVPVSFSSAQTVPVSFSSSQDISSSDISSGDVVEEYEGTKIILKADSLNRFRAQGGFETPSSPSASASRNSYSYAPASSRSTPAGYSSATPASSRYSASASAPKSTASSAAASRSSTGATSGSMDDAKLRQIFDKYDTDHSGEIDMAEAQAGAKEAGLNLNETEVKCFFYISDTNHNGKIEFGEFKRMYNQVKTQKGG